MGEEKPQKEDKTTPTNKQKKPSKGSGLTISTSDGSNSGATISTYDGGETGSKEKSNIYEDPNTGSTIATKEARTNIAEGGDYQIKASTSTPLVSQGAGPKRPKIEAGKVLFEKPKTAGPKGYTKKSNIGGISQDQATMSQQKAIISAARPSKDLATGEDLKYSGPESTTAINKASPALRRMLLGGSGSVRRRILGL
tara:strand:+ start:325 stop:915 length:591 start_codon:yes stop_codon:yes gene_type:complete